MRRIAFLLCALAMAALPSNAQKFDVDRQLEYCHKQVLKALAELKKADGSYDYTMHPRNILPTDKHKGWNCRKAVASEWCSGFWPGILWMDYECTRDEAVRRAAEGYTESLRPLASRPVYDHDLGFLMFGSFGKGYEATGNPSYKQAVLASADSIAALFNPLVGTMLSWPYNVKRFGGHNTIIDNMMNLDMMLWAAANGANPLLYDLAVTHAKTTMKHHFRPDGSSYHVAVYDTLTGDFIKGVTHQGYSDSSMWARGQSWGVYGFTMVYRYTYEKMFLDFAQKVADVYIRRLKETSDDLVPRWDMDAPKGDMTKDASAACIVASALLELSEYVGGEKGAAYRDFAMRSLECLSTDKYQSGDRNVAFLLHSTGHRPEGSEVDASIIYADYYYIEALMRAKKLQEKK